MKRKEICLNLALIVLNAYKKVLLETRNAIEGGRKWEIGECSKMEKASRKLSLLNASRILALIIRNAYKKLYSLYLTFPANIYLFRFNNRNTRKRCGICSKLTIKTPKRRD